LERHTVPALGGKISEDVARGFKRRGTIFDRGGGGKKDLREKLRPMFEMVDSDGAKKRSAPTLN